MRARSSAASSSVPISKAWTARRTTSPADSPRERAFVSSMARSSGDISTINRAEAAIANLYIYICIHIAAPISPLNRFLSSIALLGYPCSRPKVGYCVRPARRNPDHAPVDRDDEARDQHLLAGADAAVAISPALWRSGGPRLSRHRHRARRLSRSRRARGGRNRIADRRRLSAEWSGRG